MRANRLDLIAIADIENVINRVADPPYSPADILLLLEVRSSPDINRHIHTKYYTVSPSFLSLALSLLQCLSFSEISEIAR